MNVSTLSLEFLMALTIALIVLLVLFAIWLGFDLWIPKQYRGAPFVPTPKKEAQIFAEAARITPDDTVVDLGSGDGRLVVAAAQAGAKRAIGYELHPGLIWRARLNARLHGCRNTEFIKQSIWKIDFDDFDVVFMYQFPNVMEGLEEKLRNELPSGARVVVKDFPFPNWKPSRSNDVVEVYNNITPQTKTPSAHRGDFSYKNIVADD